MNIINRLLVSLLTLAALAAVTLVAAAPSATVNLAAVWLANLASWANLLLPLGRIIVAGGGFGIALLLLFWLWLEIRAPNYRTVRVVKARGSEAEVAVKTLAERLEFAVDSLPDVLEAKARLRSYRRNVKVTMRVEIKPGIDVAAKVDEIGGAIRTVVEETMGLALRGRPRVHVEAVRFPKEAFDEPEEGGHQTGVQVAGAEVTSLPVASAQVPGELPDSAVSEAAGTPAAPTGEGRKSKKKKT